MVDATEHVSGVTGSGRPVSFLRWSWPILILWTILCVVAAAAHHFEGPVIRAVAYLAPLYVAIYLARVNAFVLEKSAAEKLFSGVLLVLVAVPVTYGLTYLFSLLGNIRVDPSTGLAVTRTVLGAGPAGLLPYVIEFLAALFVFSLLVPICEMAVFGSTAGGRHAVGGVFSGLLSLSLLAGIVPLAFLIVVPLPHLVVVWRGWPWAGEHRPSPFTAKRGLRCLAGGFAVVYAIGIARSVPDQGVASLWWPQFMRDREVVRDAAMARLLTLNLPMGQGALLIGGNAYRIPADYTNGRISGWNASRSQYDYVRVRVPYSDWIAGYAPVAVPGADAPVHLEYADILITSRSRSRERQFTVLCAPEGMHDLRWCFGERPNASLLTDLGVDRQALQTLRLRGPDRTPSSRQVLVLDGDLPSPGLESGTPVRLDRSAFAALCELDGRQPSGPGDPTAEVHWNGTCDLAVDHGDATAALEMDAGLLPHWEPIFVGILDDLDAWQADARGADRMDVVADWLSEEWAQQVELLISPQCQFDRVLVAALGVDWRVSFGFRPVHSYCRHLRQGFLPGWTPDQGVHPLG